MFCSPRVFYCRCLLQLLQNNQKRVAGLHNTKVSTLGTSNKYEPNRRHQGSPVMALPPPVPEFILRGSGAPVNTLHFRCGDPGPPLLFSGSGKGAIHVWNLTTRRAEKVLEGHGGASVIWLDTLGSRDALISQGRDMRVCTWDLSEGRSDVLDSFSTGSVGFCQCSLLQSSGLSLLAHPGPLTEEIKLIDLASKTQVCSLKPDAKRGMLMCAKLWQLQDSVEVVNPGFSQLRVRQDRRILATAGWDHHVRLFGWKRLRPLAVLRHHGDAALCVAFSDHGDPRRRVLAAGSKDQRISVWSVYSDA
ncbi:guanine nucleotide-binding protein subunit beta-like protein 1 isoform X3 [Anguilla rostrata]|uniref:guanine nucleotide-binding protein subunit beta-like protein 1 isoform X3 n=1 Tax=Anguilla rostrata TaxID=7938 RepID=UPI0030D50FCA